MGGRCAAAAFYPDKLILEILRGMRDEADYASGMFKHDDADDTMVKHISQDGLVSHVGVDGVVHVLDGNDEAPMQATPWQWIGQHEKRMNTVNNFEIATEVRAPWDALCDTQCLLAAVSLSNLTFRYTNGKKEELPLVFRDSYSDEYTGEVLPTDKVREAIRDELQYFCQTVWRGCSMAEAHSVQDGKIIPSRWVLCNKGDAEHPDVRARLVGCEVNTYKDDSFYASTPPLESKRMLLSEFATRRVAESGMPLQLSFVDIRKAYFNGIPKRNIFVRLPKELGLGAGTVAKLDRCMYGTRDAAGIWETCYSDALTQMGFTAGDASPCCFYHQ